MASDLLSDRRRLERQIGELDGRIAEAVGETSASLTEVYGLGPILAAKIIGRVGDVRRFPSKANLAIKCATYRRSCDGRKSRPRELSSDPRTP